MSWTNADGLTVLMHKEQGEVQNTGSTAHDITNALVYKITDATTIGSSAADPVVNDAFIPANAYITDAYLIVDTAFTSGGSATLTIGTQTAAGADIDANGIDDAIALSALNTAGKVVALDGAQVGAAITVGSANAFLSFLYGTAAFTAGAATVVIKYDVV